jgi:4-hydroxyphenylacetate 3-monooxygenase
LNQLATRGPDHPKGLPGGVQRRHSVALAAGLSEDAALEDRGKESEMSEVKTPAGYDRLAEVLADAEEPHLLTAEQYKESLRDGRRVVDCDGREIEDVTTHPHLHKAVQTMADLLDLQHDPASQGKLTTVDEDGQRRAIGWQVPATTEDLLRKREALAEVTRRTLGVWGRPPDFGPSMAMGFLAVIDVIEKENKEFADNIRGFVRHSGDFNSLSADLILDVQSDRRVPRNDRPGTLRVVEDRDDGVVLRGTKAMGSIGSIAHFFTLSTTLSEGLAEDAAIWAAIPVGSPGITIVLREPTVDERRSTPENHPGDQVGEEMEGIIVFDDVFLPRELVFSLRNLDLLDLYRESTIYGHWHVMTRVAYRAEIFAGVAEAITDILGTTNIPGVRNAVSQITMYAQALKAFSLAAIMEAEEWADGILVPNQALVLAGRLYSTQAYPEVMYRLGELGGQGMVARWPEKIWDHPELGPKLESFLPGHGVTAREKNRFFNFVWDLTNSGHAGRVGLFENLNATPPAFVAEMLYAGSDRSEAARFVREFAGISAEAHT